MTDNFFSVFGEKLNIYLEMANNLISDYKMYKYFISSQDAFESLGIKDMNFVYWFEIIERCHYSSYTALKRQLSWIQGILNGFSNNNYLSFCANFRGFLLSSADILYSFQAISISLAENNEQIILSLNNQLDSVLMASTELENLLIHFTHARKVDKNEHNVPSIHQAKSDRNYLEVFKTENVSKCYEELCQITHPAKNTIDNFISYYENDKDIKLDFNKDEKNINGFIKKYEDCFPEIFSSFNVIFLLMKVINLLKVEDYHSESIEKYNLTNIPLYNRICGYFKK